MLHDPLTPVADNNDFKRKIVYAYILVCNCSTQNARVPSICDLRLSIFILATSNGRRKYVQIKLHKNFSFFPLWSQWMKKAFCVHLRNSLLCRRVTNTFVDCLVAATLSLSPSFIVCLHLFMFLFLACILSGLCLSFCTEFNSANNGILVQERVPKTTAKQIIN